MRVYEGTRTDEGVRVTVADVGTKEQPATLPRPLPSQTGLFNHSPTGFEYGYGGSGPAQLALAIIRNHLEVERASTVGRLHCRLTGDVGLPMTPKGLSGALDRLAVRLHQPFKVARIATLDRDLGFRMTTPEISAWIDHFEAETAHAQEVSHG